MKQELLQAIQAGERAIASLRRAEKALGSAKNWGLFDLLGGGLFADLMKHGKIKDLVMHDVMTRGFKGNISEPEKIGRIISQAVTEE